MNEPPEEKIADLFLQECSESAWMGFQFNSGRIVLCIVAVKEWCVVT